ncbi:hypothetical protein ACFQ60_03520 [Streptomyces zhihengii]
MAGSYEPGSAAYSGCRDTLRETHGQLIRRDGILPFAVDDLPQQGQHCVSFPDREQRLPWVSGVEQLVDVHAESNARAGAWTRRRPRP